MPTSLVTPTINVTLVCTIVSNPEVESVHWTSAVEGRAPSTVDEESRVSESGHYGQVTTTSTVVVLARGAEEQVHMGREVCVLCFQSLSLPLSHPSPIPLSSLPSLPLPSPPSLSAGSIHTRVQPAMPWVRTRPTSQCVREVSPCTDPLSTRFGQQTGHAIHLPCLLQVHTMDGYI